MSKRENQTVNPVSIVEPSLPSNNRQRTGVAGTRLKVTWETGMIDLIVQALLEDAPDNITALGVCFDAPNDATADAWLTQINSETGVSNMYMIPAGEARQFLFSGDGITRMDMIRVLGTDAMTVNVEAG